MKVPKKNISSELHDIKWPKKDEKKFSAVASTIKPVPIPPKRTSWLWPATTLAVIILLSAGLFVFDSSSLGGSEAKEGSVSASLKGLLDKSLKTYKNLRNFSSNTFGLIDDVSAIQALVPEALEGKKGEELIGKLKDARAKIQALSLEAEELHESGNEKFLPIGSGNPLVIASNLGMVNDFLSEFIPWLEGDKRVLVLFQNPSELRPSGGFLGSFAEINLSQGAVKNINVYDINEIDRSLGLKFAPPQPLRALSSRWYTRDANWFFGFEDSAEAVAMFVESSEVFSTENKKIDAVISVSDKVLRDILKITGPIELKKENITLNSENFLKEIQKDIQENREGGEAQPKKILKEAMPLMISSLARMDNGERKKFMDSAEEWGKERDIMMFSENDGLQRFFEYAGLSGNVYSLPRNFQGDYLAIVSANMASGKSDIVVKRKIKLTSQINSDGTVKNELIIQREHRGDREGAWWYKTANESYFKIFTPTDSSLQNLSGAFRKERFKQTTLKKYGPVSEIESTTEKLFTIPEANSLREYGKNVFAFWSKINPGETRSIKMEYAHKLFMLPSEGQKYNFVFEKQSGSQGEYDFELVAPIGFIWKETGSSIFKYETNDPPGRIILSPTLISDI